MTPSQKVAVIERYATVLSKKAEESQGGSEGQAVDAEATELEVSSNRGALYPSLIRDGVCLKGGSGE